MIRSSGLCTVDWSDGSLTKVGGLGYGKPEALEFGYGFAGGPVDLTSVGVPAAWTANGALWGFDDADDELFVADPATGDTIAIPCSFSTVDCEGLVFTTKYGDGYGQITVLCHD